MTIDVIELVQKEFDRLDEQGQWNWLVTTNLKDQFVLYMDNDDTSIYFNDDEDADYVLRFKGYLGTSVGGECLMKAIGVNAQFV